MEELLIMEGMFLVFTIIISSVVSLFVLYIVVETAVKRGFDASETNSLLQEIIENQKRY